MRHAFVRCMDGHYFLATGNPFCPLDGAHSQAAEEVGRALSTMDEPVTIVALTRAGVAADLHKSVLVVELPDAVAPPWLLQPMFDDDLPAW